MVKYIDDILSSLGWNTGIHVPVANNENAQLQAEMERLLNARAVITSQYNQIRNRREQLAKHLKRVVQEQIETESVLTVQKGHIASELDHRKSAEMEQQKLNQDITKFDKDKRDVLGRHSYLQNELCRTLNRLEELKKSVSYDTDALRIWEDALLKAQEDNAIIQKFSQQDRQKAKELELKRQKVHEEFLLRKETMKRMITDIMSLELILSKSINTYQEAKKERADLLHKWRDAVGHLRHRHKEMHLLNMEIEKLKEALNKKLQFIEEQKDIFTNETNNNKETERQITDLDKTTDKTREELRLIVEKSKNFQNEVYLTKHELQGLANHLENARIKNKKYVHETEEKNKRLEQVRTINSELLVKFESLQNKRITTNERANELQKMIQTNNQLQRTLTSQTERLQSIVYRSTQAMNALKDIENNQLLEIRTLKTTIDLLTKNEKQLDCDVQHEKETIYNIDFQICIIEGKIERIEDSLRNDYDEEQEKMINQLTETYNEKNDISNMLSKQIICIQDDIRRLANQFTNDNIQLERLQDTLQNETKMIEGGKREVKQSQLHSQEKQVEENILRLRVKQAEKVLNNINNSLYTLEKHRLEMESAMKERYYEILAERDLLILRKRNLSDDKSKLRGEIQERLLRVEQYKKRFDLATSLLGTDDDGIPLTPLYFKIKNAQEKALVQQEGDEWDAKVRKAEKEIIAMENTLSLVNNTNNRFKASLNPVDDEGPEESEYKRLEQVHYDTIKVVRSIRRSKANEIKLLNDFEQKTNLKLEDVETLKNYKLEMEKALVIMDNDLQMQQDRLDRVKRILNKLKNKIGSRLEEFQFQKELKFRELSACIDTCLHQLSDLNKRILEMSPNIIRLCDYYDLKLPTTSKHTVNKNLASLSTITLNDVISTVDVESCVPPLEKHVNSVTTIKSPSIGSNRENVFDRDRLDSTPNEDTGSF